jgi:hypothetical protein
MVDNMPLNNADQTMTIDPISGGGGPLIGQNSGGNTTPPPTKVAPPSGFGEWYRANPKPGLPPTLQAIGYKNASMDERYQTSLTDWETRRDAAFPVWAQQRAAAQPAFNEYLERTLNEGNTMPVEPQGPYDLPAGLTDPGVSTDPVPFPGQAPSAAPPPAGMLPTPPEVTAPPDFGGDVFQYNKPAAPPGPSPQELNTQMLNTAMGNIVSPFLQPLMDSLRVQQRREMQNRMQGQATRGVLNSTPGFQAREDLGRSQRGEQVGTYLGALGQQLGMQQGVSNTAFGQQNLTGQQDINNWFRFLQAQQQSDQIRTSQQNNSIALMLQALGMGTTQPQMPAFNIPAESPGIGASLGGLLGNVGTAAAGSDEFWKHVFG